MNLDRFEFDGMINFIEKAIPKDGDDSCLNVRIENDNVIFTGGTNNLAKKCILVKHPDIEESAKSKKLSPKEFMIPIGALLGFKKTMDEHKKICKKLAKNDPSYLFVEIDDTELVSNGVFVKYDQPSRKFVNLEPLFEKKQKATTDLIVIPSEMSTIMSGFEKSKQVKITFCGDTVHYQQPCSGYEAFFIPPLEDEEPPMLGDDE